MPKSAPRPDYRLYEALVVPVDEDGGSPQAVPYSPRRAAANRALFPLSRTAPSWAHVANSLWGRLVVVPLASARRAVFGRDTRRDRTVVAAAAAAGSPTDGNADKLV